VAGFASIASRTRVARASGIAAAAGGRSLSPPFGAPCRRRRKHGGSAHVPSRSTRAAAPGRLRQFGGVAARTSVLCASRAPEVDPLAVAAVRHPVPAASVRTPVGRTWPGAPRPAGAT